MSHQICDSSQPWIQMTSKALVCVINLIVIKHTCTAYHRALLSIGVSVPHCSYAPIMCFWGSMKSLPVPCRIDFKVLLLFSKCLHGLALSYLSDMTVKYFPGRSLRSSEGNSLIISETWLRREETAFSHYSPKLWNSPPEYLRATEYLSTFETRLKLHHFYIPYNNLQ